MSNYSLEYEDTFHPESNEITRKWYRYFEDGDYELIGQQTLKIKDAKADKWETP